MASTFLLFNRILRFCLLSSLIVIISFLKISFQFLTFRSGVGSHSGSYFATLITVDSLFSKGMHALSRITYRLYSSFLTFAWTTKYVGYYLLSNENLTKRRKMVQLKQKVWDSKCFCCFQSTILNFLFPVACHLCNSLITQTDPTRCWLD